MQHYIGLMSGTSMDAVDGVLASADDAGHLRSIAFASRSFDESLRRELFALQQSGPDELARAGVAAIGLARAYADVVGQLLADAPSVPRDQIAAIGAHGQTVRHRPELGFTVQLLNGAWLAELTGIDVVCDLRSADIAAGGQGAPLAPAYHQAVFGSPDRRRAVVNIGGIANVSLLDPSQAVLGYDTGPGNLLMDAWISRHAGARYDDDGQWSAAHPVDPGLLEHLLAEPYFARPFPKSTGRDLFGLDWLDGRLRSFTNDSPGAPPLPGTIQSTLLELTVSSIADACREFAAQEVFVCGGGARNAELMRRLRDRLQPCRVETTQALGIDPGTVEALAFAWLARQRVMRAAGNLPAVTGARGPAVLGALYPAPARPG